MTDIEAAESMADLELAFEDRGWQKLTTTAESEFSHAGLIQAAKVCRAMAVANPLIRRGLNLRSAYVFGQGLTVSATSEGQDVSAVIHDWWDGNTASLTGDVALQRLEHVLGTDGNLMFACHTNPLTGMVKVRTIPFEEITDIITNPDDAGDPWFYCREHTVHQLTPTSDGMTAQLVDARKVTYYPDIRHRPASKPRTIGGHEVRWDAPIHHVKVNDLEGWQYGIGDAYTAVTWARSYRDFLADWATLVKALSQFAWKATAPASKAAKLRDALARIPDQTPSANAGTVGATTVLGPDFTLEAIPKSGATIDSNSGRPLASMIAAGLDIPVTVLLADPGVTGARATAETLDAPLYAAMQQRQSLWGDVFDTLTGYVIREAVRAPSGPLTGTIVRDRWDDTETVTLTGGLDPAVTVDFPQLDSLPLDVLMDAIVKADQTEKLPPAVTARLILNALPGIDDPDAIMADLVDDNGQWIDPTISTAQAAGNAIVAAYRAGQPA